LILRCVLRRRESVARRQYSALSELRRGLRTHTRRLPPSERAEAEQFAEGLVGAGEKLRDHLVTLIQDARADSGLRVKAAGLLQSLGDASVTSSLVRVLRDPGAPIGTRWQVAQALGTLRSRRAVLPLIAVLQDAGNDLHLRKLAANSLGWIDDPRARTALLRFVEDANQPAEVRGDVAEALAMQGGEEAVPALVRVLDDPSAEVRFWALYALGSLGDESVVSKLEEIAATDDRVLPRWWSIKKEAQDAIEAIRGRATWRGDDS
jgi:HEAT repeat protein